MISFMSTGAGIMAFNEEGIFLRKFYST